MNAITALALHNNVIFVATNYGVYRLPKGHVNWQSCFDDQQPATCLQVVSNALFVGVVGGVRYTYDDGLSAITRPLSSPPPFPVVIAGSPAYENDGVIVIGTLDDGIFRSDDRGQYWTPWNFGLLELEALALVFIDPQTLLAGTSGGIFRSTTAGEPGVKAHSELKMRLCLVWPMMVYGSGPELRRVCSYRKMPGSRGISAWTAWLIKSN